MSHFNKIIIERLPIIKTEDVFRFSRKCYEFSHDEMSNIEHESNIFDIAGDYAKMPTDDWEAYMEDHEIKDIHDDYSKDDLLKLENPLAAYLVLLGHYLCEHEVYDPWVILEK